MSVSGYLAQWWEPTLTVGEERVADFEKAERERLAHLLSVAIAASGVPRRPGPEANVQELAADKKLCKRIAHVANQSLVAWGGKLNGGRPGASEAAQVQWHRWWDEHNLYLTNRIRYIATWALTPGRTAKEQRWAKSAVVRLTNEQQWLQYAFR